MTSTKETLATEIDELETLLTQTQTVGNRRDLNLLLQRKQKVLKAASAARTPETCVAPAEVHPMTSDLTTFTEISRFGWEDDGYGKEKVMVYITSGIDGVGNLPKENVTCHFTKTSFDLKVRRVCCDGVWCCSCVYSRDVIDFDCQILRLNNRNYRLFKQHLEKEIDPEKSTFSVKKNRVTLSLHKMDKNNAWMNLTAKNPLKSSSQPESSDQGASIMNMMKNMYDEGDDEMKRTIAKAWTESRAKHGADNPF
ncbi:hypothetical protein PsorP6_003115 [Peronosclerospora sorghi]|uniref:Uncharacterized protein n=1 Tax=Peronosclerospora sorghi TaxID=230839 RepID=A0ACC0VQG3_9STRA|nr:hypothetical protein PsorP6_019306 [Peronosclerospora sorghi]KAI9908699.1 hypothetical protein PsorP6_003115 [Peronosclerospora sorghi]